jgi:prepilin-type N-terminal cleavage/methylation domain-containing protein
MGRLGNRRGFALVELLVGTAVIGIVMAGIFVLQRGGQQAYLFGSSRVETQQNARVALDLLTRELRSAGSITTITSATDITFKNQSDQTIRYTVSGTTLNRTVGTTTTALIGGIQSLAITCYSVYDVYSNTYTTTTTPAQAKVITISVTTKTEESVATGSPGARYATMETAVTLRAKQS